MLCRREMPQIAFFVGGVSVGAGGLAFLIAWDRRNRGPGAADDIAAPFDGEVGIYSLVTATTGAQLIRAKSRSPIAIPEANCPSNLNGFPDRDFLVHFSLKPGGTAVGPFPDLLFEVFEGSNRIYQAGANGSPMKAELADGSFGLTETSFQDRLTFQLWDDPLQGLALFINTTTPTSELWRALMTPDQPLTF
jgi:hypothetical protein